MHGMFRLTVLLFSTLVLAATDGLLAEDALQGKWSAQVVKCSGTECEVAQGLQCEFSADSVVAKYGDNNITVGYTVQGDKPAKELAITIGGSVSWKGIYEIDGDKLTICVVPATGEVPGEFETKEGDGRVLLLLERGK